LSKFDYNNFFFVIEKDKNLYYIGYIVDVNEKDKHSCFF